MVRSLPWAEIWPIRSLITSHTRPVVAEFIFREVRTESYTFYHWQVIILWSNKSLCQYSVKIALLYNLDKTKYLSLNKNNIAQTNHFVYCTIYTEEMNSEIQSIAFHYCAIIAKILSFGNNTKIFPQKQGIVNKSREWFNDK